MYREIVMYRGLIIFFILIIAVGFLFIRESESNEIVTEKKNGFHQVIDRSEDEEYMRVYE